MSLLEEIVEHRDDPSEVAWYLTTLCTIWGDSANGICPHSCDRCHEEIMRRLNDDTNN